jgi:hypothetical protein
MGGSSLLLAEYFEQGDERFLAELLSPDTNRGTIKSFAAKWAADTRPFARKAMLGYLRGNIDQPGHRPVLKALFKASEAKGDDEAMAHFLVAFDKLTTRKERERWQWDMASRTSSKVTELVWRRDLLRHYPTDLKNEERRLPSSDNWRPGNDRFSITTRRYLQRRAWRYFRKLSRKEPLRYRSAILVALKLYTDESLRSVSQLMDSWGLLSALYGSSKVIVRPPKGAEVAEGKLLAELEPAPYAPKVWSECLDDLLALYLEAQSQTVRTWTLKLLRRDYTPKLKGLPMSKVRLFLRHPSKEAQELGAELLRGVEGLEQLPLAEWMTLLALDNEAAMPIICELVKKHVHPDRLTLAQCVELARSSWAPVADLGFGWAKARKVAPADLPVLAQLASAKVAHVRKDASEWLAQLILLNEGADLWLHVRRLLDDNKPEPRAAALALMEKDKRFGDRVELWQSMAESPWPDVRAALLKDLPKRLEALTPNSLERIWATALLAVKGSARPRTRAMQQVAERIVSRPDEAERLLTLLGYMLRSAMPNERRAALGQITRAAVRSTQLQKLVAVRLPELALGKLEVAS